jgi:hypothetical protein
MPEMRKIRIIVDKIILVGELGDSGTARKIWEALPFESRITTWGDEIYFEIPVETDLEPDARADVEVGELGYWPPGRAMCVFFGPTPASSGEEPRAASPVNVFGRIEEGVASLKGIGDGTLVKVEQA